jgi:hypothetical protein
VNAGSNPATEVAQLLSADRYASPRRLNRFGWRAFSQSDEDGMIQEIFRRIGTTDRRFVELGAGDGSENNTAYLLACGWSGGWVEGDPARAAACEAAGAVANAEGRLRVVGATVTRDNVDRLIARTGISGEIDLLSIDLDGIDYYVLERLRSLNPRAVVAEYNASYRPPVRWIVAYDDAFTWDGTSYFGASLGAYEDLMRARGYALVGCNLAGVNAFFVRNDCVGDLFEAPFTAANHYEPPRYYLVGVFAALSGHPPQIGPATVSPEPIDVAQVLSRITSPRLKLAGDAVRLADASGPRRVAAGAPFVAEATLINASDGPLASFPPHPVRFAYLWLDANGAIIGGDQGRSAIAPACGARESRRYAIGVTAPPAPGTYTLRLTVVQELVRWFDTACDSIVQVDASESAGAALPTSTGMSAAVSRNHATSS